MIINSMDSFFLMLEEPKVSETPKSQGFPPLAATRRTRGFSNGNKANDPNEDGPNDLFDEIRVER